LKNEHGAIVDNVVVTYVYAKLGDDRNEKASADPRPQQEQLDGQGKARREAARRRNSECKINLSSRNSSCSNGSRPTAQR